MTARVRQEIGTALAEWDEADPLLWTMSEWVGNGQDTRQQAIKDFELASLRDGYAETFLLALKEVALQRRHTVALTTIDYEVTGIRNLLRICHEKQIIVGKVSRINSAFLIGLETIKASVSPAYLQTLRRLFAANRHNPALFDKDLHAEDFPVRKDKRGFNGKKIDRILASALTRASMVHILNVTEEAYESGKLDLGRYSFLHLAMQTFARPKSYASIQLKDLRSDKNPETGQVTYFLDLPIPKTGVHGEMPKASIRLHPNVGDLLAAQRQAVIERIGHMALSGELGLLPLFPAIDLARSKYAREHKGALKDSNSCRKAYLDPIRDLTNRLLTFNVLRHTVATQLALIGCSATTIAAVLKHGNDKTARVYVDLFFDGLMDKLSDVLEPAFVEHYPVFDEFCSKNDPIPPAQRIVSEDDETGKRETTARCGREVQCNYAPIACYECRHFKPAYDADHSINLDVVEREIKFADDAGLAMATEARRYKHIRNCIRVVIIVCDAKRRAMSGMAPN